MFTVFLKINKKLAKKCPQKTITFHILQNTSELNKTLCCDPPLDQTLVFVIAFFKEKHWCWTKNKLTNRKTTKIRKGDLKETRGETNKNEKGLMKKLCNWIVWCCSFHKTKAMNKQKERKRQKQVTKRKQKRKTRRKNEKKKRETEKVKKGEAKKG